MIRNPKSNRWQAAFPACALALAFFFALALTARAQDARQRDLDGDGDPDLIETVWNGHKVVWIDDNDNMKWGAQCGDQVGDCVMIDLNGDGRVDGPGDMAVKWADADHDGKPDWQFIAIEAGGKSKEFGQSNHWMVWQDVDHDGVMASIDWTKFSLECWAHTAPCKFLPDYNGNSIFLKLHGAASTMDDPTLNWENPFAFYDMDHNGYTDMAIRLCDPVTNVAGKSHLTGKIDSAYLTMDIDGDAGPANEMDYDFSIRFNDGAWDYTKWVHKIPSMRGLPATDDMFPIYKSWRTLTELKFVPHEKCFDELFKQTWKSCYYTFDEDDDDHRWERVELYYPMPIGSKEPNDPWSLVRRGFNAKEPGGLCWNIQADSIGDRGEYDMDFSGKAQLYFSPLDAKLHLYGAEWGAWTLDDGTYHGGWGEPTNRPSATQLKGVVIYKDTNNDGFMDTIQCDWNSDKKFEQTFSVAALGKEADQAPVWNPATLKYAGLRSKLDAAVNEHWKGLLSLYQACERNGIPGVQTEQVYLKQTQAERLMSAWDLRLKAREAILKSLATRDGLKPEHRKALAEKIEKTLLLGQCSQAAAILDKEL